MSAFTTPETILMGEQLWQEAAALLCTYGTKALIVTGKHVGKSRMLQELLHCLEESQISYEVFDEITGEPDNHMIAAGVARYQDTDCDFCIGIGGGSPLDSAKAIAAMVDRPGDISDYMGKEIQGPVPPIVAIPTTAGTGSEATKFTIITDLERDIKMLLKGDCLLPRLALVDPRLGLDAPASVTASTGLDALTHAVEAYTSRKAMPLTDALTISAVGRILTYLPQAYQDGSNLEARRQMAAAALEAGISIHNSSVTLVHGMSRPIGALFHVPHGISNAMLLIDCLEFAMDGALDRFGNLARAVGAAEAGTPDEEAAYKLLEKIRELCRTCEVPDLKTYGIPQEAYEKAIQKMAQDAIASGSPGNTRKTVTIEDCCEIYRRAYLK